MPADRGNLRVLGTYLRAGDAGGYLSRMRHQAEMKIQLHELAEFAAGKQTPGLSLELATAGLMRAAEEARVSRSTVDRDRLKLELAILHSEVRPPVAVPLSLLPVSQAVRATVAAGGDARPA